MARILITSALPYINGIKHLGNLAGSMLPADVYARFKRAQGHEVLYICATDEHGTPAELAAAAAGQDVRTYCEEQHEVQKAAGQAFGLSYDWFGRSSNAPNQRLTQHFAHVLEQNGLIEERVDRTRDRLDVGDGEAGLGEPARGFQRHLLGPAGGGREFGQDHDMHGDPPGDRSRRPGG